MLDLAEVLPDELQLVDAVVMGLLEAAPTLRPEDVMLVGARCRDILHTALGHEFVMRATSDVDVAIAIPDWEAYRAVLDKFERIGANEIRRDVRGIATDVMPFGIVEDPIGTVSLGPTSEDMNVWGFRGVFEASLDLDLPDAGVVRIASPAGYAALKIAAWMDRSAYLQDKDAADLAVTLYWYAESSHVFDRLYDSEELIELMVEVDSDVPVAAAWLLGRDIRELVGADRLDEILGRWADLRPDTLSRAMKLPSAPRWPRDPQRRLILLAALKGGLEAAASWSSK